MATVAGQDADLTVGSLSVCAHSWSMDINIDALEDTSWCWTGDDVGWRSYIPGLKGFSGSFECYASDVPSSALIPTTAIAGRFYVKKSTFMGYKGSVVITGVHPGVDIDGIATLTYDYQGTGALQVGNINPSTTTTAAP